MATLLLPILLKITTFELSTQFKLVALKWMLAFIPIGMSDLSDEIKLVIFSLMYLAIFAYRNFYKPNKPEDEDEVQKMHLTDKCN